MKELLSVICVVLKLKLLTIQQIGLRYNIIVTGALCAVL